MAKKPDTNSDAMASFRRFLEAKGLRLTRDRRAIVEEIFANHQHFSIDELFIALHLKGHRLSKTTLYRNLPLLIESGLVRRVPDDAQGRRFEHVLGHRHHDHLICMECGRQIEFSSERIEAVQDQICRRQGFEPVRHRLGIWGYCRDCRRRRARAKTTSRSSRNRRRANDDGKTQGRKSWQTKP